MKPLRFFLLTVFLFPFLVSGQKEEVFPYNGGENQLLHEFFDFYYRSKNSRDELEKCLRGFKDSAGIYFIEISYSPDSKKVSATVYGSIGNDELAKIIRQFFEQTINNWDKKLVKKSRVIIPVLIANAVAMQPDAVHIEWTELSRNNTKMRSGSCFFVKPIVRSFWCNPPDMEQFP